MDLEQKYYSKLDAAKKKVAEIKAFHSHVIAYITINLFLVFFIKIGVVDFLQQQMGELDPQILYWIDVNVVLTPVLWGIGLLIHGLYVYRHKFGFDPLKRWEEKQMEKLLEEEEAESEQHYN